MSHPRLARVLLVCLLMLTLTGCSFDDVMLIEDIFWEWTSEKNLNPRNEQGGLDPAGSARAAVEVVKREVTGSTGDKEADAVLGIGEAIENLRPWDKEVNTAIETGNETTIHEALVLYENDYHYRDALAVMQLSKGDVANAKATLSQALLDCQKAQPKHSAERINLSLLRDRLALLDRAIKNEGKNGTTSAGKQQLRSYYCDWATWLKTDYGDKSWLDRAKSFNCDQ
jgi:hypothetical protein